MKPAMETAAEENTEQSQERKGSKNAKHLAKAGIANRFRMPHLSLGRWDC
ncbi:glycoprotein m6b, isoform CRA_e [Mus musculus]|uniref:Isoform 7 of Neuronal membrane glycoprotein M6-b n=1 Tax=Mus musculus TaxID=10090 RepID=P35803-7|nr:proteolipid M6B isoform alpha-gamma [Mus musculus]EDL40737.1 glycoprotein m6b, isoform CRA_e [Mus musculus]